LHNSNNSWRQLKYIGSWRDALRQNALIHTDAVVPPGLDEIGLVATGNWRDPRSARRYAHAVAREEWSKVDLLPSIGRGKSVE